MKRTMTAARLRKAREARKSKQEASVPNYVRRFDNEQDVQNWLKADKAIKQVKGTVRFSGKSWKVQIDGGDYDSRRPELGMFLLKITDKSGYGHTDYLFELVHDETRLKVSFKMASDMADIRQVVSAQIRKHAWRR